MCFQSVSFPCNLQCIHLTSTWTNTTDKSICEVHPISIFMDQIRPWKSNQNWFSFSVISIAQYVITSFRSVISCLPVDISAFARNAPLSKEELTLLSAREGWHVKSGQTCSKIKGGLRDTWVLKLLSWATWMSYVSPRSGRWHRGVQEPPRRNGNAWPSQDMGSGQCVPARRCHGRRIVYRLSHRSFG